MHISALILCSWAGKWEDREFFICAWLISLWPKEIWRWPGLHSCGNRYSSHTVTSRSFDVVENHFVHFRYKMGFVRNFAALWARVLLFCFLLASWAAQYELLHVFLEDMQWLNASARGERSSLVKELLVLTVAMSQLVRLPWSTSVRCHLPT